MIFKTKISLSVLTMLVIVIAIFSTTCDSPLGMGDPIDWEPPVLTLDEIPNPLYVRTGTTLTGKATDNVRVDRIVFLDSNGKELFPVNRNGDLFSIRLDFPASLNGEKIVAEIRAYDKMGNSGGTATAFVTMIIDIGPPVVQYMDIKRTDTRIAQFESFTDLQTLSDTKANLFSFQNGMFYVDAIVDDAETNVKVTKIEFYDAVKGRYNLLYSQDIDSGYTPYLPRWTIKEEDIINAGAAKYGASYLTDYYNNGARYYFRVVVTALDMSNNTNRPTSEDRGYICLWANSDKPKGIVDPSIVGSVAEGQSVSVGRNTSLPVEFYDDDSLLWAYTALLKKTQWDAIAGADSAAKLQELKNQLTNSTGDTIPLTVSATSNVLDWANNKIPEQIQGKNIDEKLVYLVTGNSNSDYGDYALFTVVADKKNKPHPTSPTTNDVWTSKPSWTGRVLFVTVKDENAPLIVFDTASGSPEENTFPQTITNGKFTIKGYTLRENSGKLATKNKVSYFRMAWIPYGISGGQESKVDAVKEALKADYTKTSAQNSSELITKMAAMSDVQYWDFSVVETTTSTPGTLTMDSPAYEYKIGEDFYTRQSFQKTFSILGDNDDIKTNTNNFWFNGALENETKLFIFYAQDSMGNDVFRQLPILGKKDKPEILITDITHNTGSALPSDIPNPTASGNFSTATGAPTEQYYKALKAYNERQTVRTILQNTQRDDEANASKSFEIYPRGTTVKFWVRPKLDQNATIKIVTITMKDITFADANNLEATQIPVGSGFIPDSTNGNNSYYSFCEFYPDVTQRTFLFEAADQLGNKTAVQRTIAVSNAARLESITTTEQSGTYGYGKILQLQANFSSQIYVVKGTTDSALTENDQNNKPGLNIRYQKNGDTNTWYYETIRCNSNGSTPDRFGLLNPTISLIFDWTIPLNATGRLETLHEGNNGSIQFTQDRPIHLPNSENATIATKIMDNTRKGSAFIPGYSSENITMPNWNSDTQNSLQKRKEIILDGVLPRITSVGLDSTAGVVKAPYSGTGTTAERYFTTGDTLSIVLTGSEPIRAFSNARLSYTITPSSGSAQTYNTSFKYVRPVSGNPNQLLFSLKVDTTSCPIDGEITDIRLLQGTDSDIIDNADNKTDTTTTPINFLTSIGQGKFFIKKTQPVKPAATLSNTPSNTTNSPLENLSRTNFNGTVSINIPNSSATQNAAWEDRKQYSIDGGLTWLPTPLNGTNTAQTYNITTAGTFNIQVRYLDRAGNEGVVAKNTIVINNTFPALISVNAVQPKGWYISGSNLTFNLNFADTVTVTTQSSVTITLKNRASSTTSDNEITLTTNMTSTNGAKSTITFPWNNITGKEMQAGLYISNLVLSGLTDKFGLQGPASATGTYTPNTINLNSCANLTDDVKVDAIAPTVTTRVPAHNGTPSGNNNITQIVLTFRESVMKGSGTITIRPRGNYAIPPVFEDSGYYLGTDGNKYTSAGTNRTYISSFYDIYNYSTLTPAERNYLTQGATTANGANQTNDTTNPSASRLMMNTRTGQSKGPYKKMTQGLIAGLGYSGNYTGTNVTSGTNSPDAANPTTGNYMVPDLATKWVLDYQYLISDTTNDSAVSRIRGVLTKAKFRWQEIDVANTSVVVSGSTATITLNEPLLKGLEYDVYYPAGTFTDLAGNSSTASGVTNTNPTLWTNSDYYFTTPGVQPPVIRVNRRSFDARNSNWSSSSNRTYQAPSNTTNWANATTAIADNGLATDTGWGITDFNAVHYRVESESPGVTMTVGTLKGANGAGSASGAWTGNVSAANSSATIRTDMTWNQAEANTPGTWVLNNIVRRSGINQTYTVTTRKGTTESRTLTRSDNNAAGVKMFRSYNKDATLSELNNSSPSSVTLTDGAYQGVLTFNALESNKSYVAAEATKNGQSAKGYEGVYRTVIALLFSGDKTNNFLLIEGSNIKNGMPSVAGFPVRDAEETGDNRFIKVFFHNDSGANQRRQFYWVSTEIVCEWYFLYWGGGGGSNSGGGGSHQRHGEVNNYLTVGYGDLTYAYNLETY